MVGETKTKKISMKLIASLAPARAEIEAGAVAKAGQKLSSRKYHLDLRNVSICTLEDNLKSVKV